MVIDNFNIGRTVFRPNEANSILIVDTNTVLILAITFQALKSVPWASGESRAFVRHPIVLIYYLYILEHSKLTWIAPFKQFLCIFAAKGLDHVSLYYVLRNTSIRFSTILAR